MSAVASKNLYELLGNDPDSEGEVKPPKKEVVKSTTTTKKKDVVVDSPSPAHDTHGRGGQGGAKGNRPPRSGNDAVRGTAFHDRNAGRESNRSRPTDEPGARPPRGRGGPRGRGRGREYDRHSATGRVDSEKQVNQGWGSNDNEWAEEKEGESIAQAEANDENVPVAAETQPVDEAETTPAVPEEPEEKVKTYDDYLAERAAKQATLGSLPQARPPNDGREDAKWKNATVLKKDEEEEQAYFAGKEAKARKEKERKQKQLLEIDQRFQDSYKGGRGDRGGRGRGDRRGGRGGTGGHRGGRNYNGPGVDTGDTNAFPPLG
ncbi:hypothetical protein BDZ91DRAFT_761012 [Kalaharituber pfeilii]|nr:hypothetical protein BDZ91DRAFT_761012 [Kalaharituber pfeilii]